MNEEKTISLKCPVCDNTHSYQLTITYDPVLGLLTDQKQDHAVKRRLVFVCPVKNTKFLATIPVRVQGRLRQVSVGKVL